MTLILARPEGCKAYLLKKLQKKANNKVVYLKQKQRNIKV